jgi:hypothetical protein
MNESKKRVSIAPIEAALMTDADLDKTIAVLQGVQETRKRGRPPKHGQSTYAAVVSKSSAPAKTSNAVSKKKDDIKQPAKAIGSTQAKKEPNAVLQMRKEILEMRKEIAELKKQLAQVLSKQTTASVTQTLRTVNVAASDAQERARRSKNVIIRGIPPTNGDDDENNDSSAAVRAFLTAVCPAVNVENAKLQRLQNSRNDDSSGKRNPVSSVLVVLNSVEDQQAVLKAARHHDKADFNGVFAHEDRTRAQQLQYSECAKQAKDKNRRLAAVELLDQPFRFVVRGDRVRCIDASHSSVAKKSVYVDERTVQLEIQRKQGQKLDEAITNGHVNARRSHTAVSNAATSGEAQGSHH